jgi:hypothetical protein
LIQCTTGQKKNKHATTRWMIRAAASARRTWASSWASAAVSRGRSAHSATGTTTIGRRAPTTWGEATAATRRSIFRRTPSRRASAATVAVSSADAGA